MKWDAKQSKLKLHKRNTVQHTVPVHIIIDIAINLQMMGRYTSEMEDEKEKEENKKLNTPYKWIE